MSKEPLNFNLDTKSEAVVTRSQITTTIPNTGTLKTPTGEHYSVQVVTTLPYGTTVLRHAVTLGVAGANNYFRYAWGPQGSNDPAYVDMPKSTDDEIVKDMLSRNETSLLETAQTRHAMLFEGQENTAALLNAIETLTKRAKTVLAKQAEQEPVAYIYDDEVFGVDSGTINDHIREHGTPLYARPTPSHQAVNQRLKGE